MILLYFFFFFFFQAEDGIRDKLVTGVQTCALPISIKAERRMEYVYYRGMASLLDVDDRTERIARRELYRRCSRIGETVIRSEERRVGKEGRSRWSREQ